MVASALATELLVTCLQHPLKHQAPSDTNSNGSQNEDLDDKETEASCLGIVPHQVNLLILKHQIHLIQKSFYFLADSWIFTQLFSNFTGESSI